MRTLENEYVFVDEKTPWLQNLLMDPKVLDDGSVEILKNLNGDYVYAVEVGLAYEAQTSEERIAMVAEID